MKAVVKVMALDGAKPGRVGKMIRIRTFPIPIPKGHVHVKYHRHLCGTGVHDHKCKAKFSVIASLSITNENIAPANGAIA
jgi:hypothetical protein